MNGVSMLLVTALALLITAASGTRDVKPPANDGHEVRPQFGWSRPPVPWRPWWPSPSPPPPPPSPAYDDFWCNRTYGPEAVLTADDDVDCATTRAEPTRPTPPTCVWPCAWPRWPRPAGGVGSSNGVECAAAMAPLMTCASYVSGNSTAAPKPSSICCTGLAKFLHAAAAARGGDRLVQCLCPLILGDMNKMMAQPADAARILYLPVSCDVLLPPKIMYLCFTGQEHSP